MPAPDSIRKLVETFEHNLNEYHTHKNETELRRQFLDPFFEALGWDVSNTRGYDERRKEVAHELSVEIDGQQKKADYAFRAGTQTNAGKFDFLVEAKKPSVKIESHQASAFQVKRYGWSAKLPVNILTDFEHFAVYDCRAKPSYKDKVTAGRMHLFHYKEYIEKWDEIAALFSPEAVRAGALDTYIEGAKGKKGTADVDDDFLAEIERWRELLARNIANRNKDKGLTENQLNYAVQMTIDRIVFLRIAEERGMEEYGRLKNLCDPHPSSPKSAGEKTLKPKGSADLGEGSIYAELKKYFVKADERYNSGLFHFKAEKERVNPDTVTFDLQIDDKALKDIIENLYEPKSPYAFAYIPADILGSVYERFLGKVIRLTAGGGAKVEDKPEVRKAGGVYYTPVYIVEYIVKNTVGKLTEGKTPKEVAEIKVVDPACGSGSFLLGAYQYLLNWHLDWYTQNEPEKHLKNKVLLTQDNKTYRLSMNEKKRILLNNIHGVDVDPQAVEVTKLSLLLKVVEDPGQLTMFEEGHILPDLGNNIKCGNSLIGMDYFDGQLMADPTEIARVNPFDWKSEFPQVFKRGGFDAVIGNPPYIRIQTLQEISPIDVGFFKKIYKAASKGGYDIYVVFVEKALGLLNKNGLLSYILPHKFFQSQFGQPMREIISARKALRHIVHFGAEQVFQNATTYTCLMFLSATPQEKFRYSSVDTLNNPFETLAALQSNIPHPSYKEIWLSQPEINSEWNFSATNDEIVLRKLYQQPLRLADITRKVFVGLQTSADKIFVLKIIEWREHTVLCYSKSLEQEVEIEQKLVKPFLFGKDVHRYQPPKSENVVIFPYQIQSEKAILMQQSFLETNFPRGWQYLISNKIELSEREKGKFRNTWWQYGRTQNLTEFEFPKVMTPEIALGSQLTFDDKGSFYHTTKIYSFVFEKKQQENPLFFLGILNSKLLWLFLKSTGYVLRGGYFTFKTEYLKPFPICTINFSDSAEKAKHDQIVTLVERMLALHKNLASAKTPQEKEAVQRQVESTDSQIDTLVYELYGLTDDEIKIVEGN